LIVDDNDDVREVIEYFVAMAGYTVTGARSGREALEKLRTIHPCIITLDLMMPDMTGVDFRQAQLADPSFSEVPVVVYSAAFNGGQTAARIGAAAFVEKSQSANDLLRVIREYCLK
jgi:CheY-like chemotaxis protein